MSEPDCPKCPFTPMNPVTLEGGVQADECPKCRGQWFDAGELAKASKDAAAMARALADAPLRPREGKANCPRCLKAMVNGGLGSEFIRVDRCVEHGVWLDAGERRLLAQMLGL
ncbi:MAG: zf-TFIIB domain-containing protein [Elusimicrobiota bacterium]|nr:zf-TFIIB domain-containing protein [Elusimicrobiota bacterium]